MSKQMPKRGKHLTVQPHPLIQPHGCPACNGRMVLTLVMPTLLGVKSDNATYTCAECGHEETRTLAWDAD
jgi:transcription elongation factor Elf1